MTELLPAFASPAALAAFAVLVVALVLLLRRRRRRSRAAPRGLRAWEEAARARSRARNRQDLGAGR